MKFCSWSLPILEKSSLVWQPLLKHSWELLNIRALYISISSSHFTWSLHSIWVTGLTLITFMCVWRYVYIYISAHVCRFTCYCVHTHLKAIGQYQVTSSIFFTSFLRHSLSVNLEVTIITRLAGQQPQSLYFFGAGITNMLPHLTFYLIICHLIIWIQTFMFALQTVYQLSYLCCCHPYNFKLTLKANNSEIPTSSLYSLHVVSYMTLLSNIKLVLKSLQLFIIFRF